MYQNQEKAKMKTTQSNPLPKLGKFTVNKQELLEVQRNLDFFVGLQNGLIEEESRVCAVWSIYHFVLRKTFEHQGILPEVISSF